MPTTETCFAGWPGGVAYKIPLDPAIQKEMNEKYATGAGWSLRESLPTLARAYLYTGEKRYLDLFMEPVKHLQKSAAFSKMVNGSGWRTTGCHFDWSNEADRALEEKRIDSTPPGAVTDLRVEALGGGRVRLIWSKPGGDPVGYKVKWADRPMIDRIDWQTQAKTHTNWWAAQNVADEPGPNGAKGSMIVEGVPEGRRVFAIRSRDAAGNRSAISNMATVEVK